MPASIDAAMTGIETVVLVSPAVPAQELNVIGAAARAGAQPDHHLPRDHLRGNRDAMIRAGVPAAIAEMNAQAFCLTAEGDAEWTTEDVPSLLGRPARTFEQFAADYAAAFS